MSDLFPELPTSSDPSARLNAARVRLAAAFQAEEWMEMQGGPENQAEADAIADEIKAARAEVNLLENEAMERLKQSDA